MIPAAHLLGDPRRDAGMFMAECACGLQVWGRRLPMVFDAHQIHLNIVREMSRRAHPTTRKDGAA